MADHTSGNKVVLVTGGNKGIGKEAVRLLAEQLPSSTILLGSRSLSNGQSALADIRSSSSSSSYDNIQVVQLDVTDKQSIQQAVEHVKSSFGRLDILLNNSGISKVGKQGVHAGVLDVNLYGVHSMIEAFTPLMTGQGSLLITVSSEVGAWTTHDCEEELRDRLLNPSTLSWSAIDNLAQDYIGSITTSSTSSTSTSTSTSWASLFGTYGVSKALLSAYIRVLARDHQPHQHQLKAVIVCPGWCKTDLNGNTGPRTSAQGGASVIWPVTHADEAQNGGFYQDGRALEFTMPVPTHVQEAMKKMHAAKDN